MPKIEEAQTNSYKGYSLFNDVQDKKLQIINRGAIMANILQEHLQGAKVSRQGLALILGYFHELLPIDRKSVKASFEQHLTERGISYGAV